MEDQKNLNKAAYRTMKILDYIAEERRPVTITELSKYLHIPKSSVFSLVYTLLDGKYLEMDSSTKTFKLGFKLFQAGVTYLSQVQLHQTAHPILHDLMEKVNDTVHLAVEDDNHLVFIDSIEAEKSVIRSISRLGRSSVPMYCSGLGKAILASWSDEKLERTFSREPFHVFTPRTISSFSDLMVHIRRIRQCGYALDDRESSNDLYCTACPVYDRTNKVIAAISVSVPMTRLDNRQEFIRDAVQETAMMISLKLGWTRNSNYSEFH
jgi:DNA-binding IclR family transcriptional regulator